MNKLLALMAFSAVCAYSQISQPQTFVRVGTDPAGVCTSSFAGYNYLNGNIWGCVSSAWTKLNGSVGSGVSSVGPGTAPSWLTISVANGTTTPTISIGAATAQTAHQVLGTGTGSTFGPISLTVSDLPTGTSSSTVALGNDSRFLNATSLSGVSISSLSGLLKLTTGSPSAAAYSDVVSLFGSGSCSGFLKNDGTCGSGSAGVTSFSVTSVPSWLSSSVATATSTPALTLSAATGQTTHQVIGTGAGTSFGPMSLTVSDLPTGTSSSTVAIGNDSRFLNATLLSGVSIAALSGVLKLTTGSPSAASSSDIIGLFGGGTCSGYLKSDGSCSSVGTVSSVGLTMPTWLTVSGSPVTTSGTLAVSAATGQTTHQVIGTGAGASFGPISLTASDIPQLTATNMPALTGDTTSSAGSTTTTTVAVHGTSIPTNAAADQTIVTTASATGSWASLPSCIDSAGQHLNYNTSTHLFSCGTTGGTAGSAAFNTITGGTNTSAAMLVGTGASLGSTGSGTITANAYSGTVPTGNLPSTTVESVTNDTNVTGSISSQALTLGWTGTLAKARQYSNTVYSDSAATFGAFNYDYTASVVKLGSYTMPVRSVSTTTPATTADYAIFCNAASAGFTITLPASPLTGELINIKKTDSSANSCTISGGSATIDGSSTVVISVQYTSIQMIFDGTNWEII